MNFPACAPQGPLETARDQSDEAAQFRPYSGVPNPKGRFDNLAVVLERLWVFLEAMRRGTPVPHSTELLDEMSTALKQASTVGKVRTASPIASPATNAFS